MKAPKFILFIVGGVFCLHPLSSFAQKTKKPHNVDRPVDTKPIKFDWKLSSNQHNDQAALALRAGPNLSYFYGSPTIPSRVGPGNPTQHSIANWGYLVGILAEIPVAEYTFVQPELDYNRFITRILDFPSNSTLYLSYFMVPIMVKYKPIDGLSIFAGPKLDVLMDAQQAFNDSSTVVTRSLKKSFTPLGVSYQVGLGYGFSSGFGLDLRYSNTFYPVGKAELGRFHSPRFELSLRYFFYDL